MMAPQIEALVRASHLPTTMTYTTLKNLRTATTIPRLSTSPTSTRPFSTTPTTAAPLVQFGSSSSNQQPSYFQSQRRLPANTIVKFVPQQTAWIVERVGKFNRILQPGLAILVPVLDRIAYVQSLKENAIEIPSQSAITADNVTLELDGVLYTRVFDAYKASCVLAYTMTSHAHH